MGIEDIIGKNCVKNSGEVVETASFCAEGKIVGLYFSAHWCPPCRGFTPKLVEFYNNVKSGPHAAELEIIFVSCDNDEEAFKDYFNTMPWLSIAYAEDTLRDGASEKFGVSGIPSFILLKADTGEIITTEGRGKVMSDPDGFPWAS